MQKVKNISELIGYNNRSEISLLEIELNKKGEIVFFKLREDLLLEKEEDLFSSWYRVKPRIEKEKISSFSGDNQVAREAIDNLGYPIIEEGTSGISRRNKIRVSDKPLRQKRVKNLFVKIKKEISGKEEVNEEIMLFLDQIDLSSEDGLFFIKELDMLVPDEDSIFEINIKVEEEMERIILERKEAEMKEIFSSIGNIGYITYGGTLDLQGVPEGYISVYSVRVANTADSRYGRGHTYKSLVIKRDIKKDVIVLKDIPDVEKGLAIGKKIIVK